MINIHSDQYHIVMGPEMYKDILDMTTNTGVEEPAYVSSIMSGVRLVVDPALSDGEYYMASDSKMWLPEAYRDWRRTELARDYNREMFLDHYMARVPEPEPEPEPNFDISIYERYGMGLFNNQVVFNNTPLTRPFVSGSIVAEPKTLKWNFEF